MQVSYYHYFYSHYQVALSQKITSISKNPAWGNNGALLFYFGFSLVLFRMHLSS
ncbi:hypothetical protein HMPREF0044_0998 [Gleimia coleocanis DSM 15436]|uniref:Uncharacterized protein n=1 Tax=Gleimia coleocanis DSM 15436 TaxID=525245 RepID=C0W0C0_9ACTO|nr:hypothetical protein HMPREF0044_0998 [Gleimia coleocanis DSM 15436]